MTEALEIRTPHTDVSEIVRELAPAVDDLSIRLPCERPIAAGEWVRFVVRLSSGRVVFEGVGRADGIEGAAPSRRVLLTRLSFEPESELMYERMLLARDAAEETSPLDVEELGAELVRGPSRIKPPPPPARARRPSTLPPPPRSHRPSTLPPPSAAPPPARPPRPSVPPPPASPKRNRANDPPAAPTSQPWTSRSRSDAPERPPKGRRGADPGPDLAARTSEPVRAAPTKSNGLAAKLQATPSSPSTRPPSVRSPAGPRLVGSEPAASPRALQLTISPSMVTEARKLAPTLPQLAPPDDEPPEEAVLRTALRLGLAALAALDQGDP